MAMMPHLYIPPLGVSEDEAQRKFEQLQQKLVPLWQRIRQINDSEQTIVVAPSQSRFRKSCGSGQSADEEHDGGGVEEGAGPRRWWPRSPLPVAGCG